MKSAPALLAILTLAFSAVPAVAGAPEPRRSVEIDRFMGRWYEIARTPNFGEKNCWSPLTDWSRTAPGRFAFVQTCRKGSPSGPVKSSRGTATIADPRTNAKIDMALLGGAIHQQYWVLDHADDYSWSIIGTPGGNYIWLMARKASLTAVERDTLLRHARGLGYSVAKLQYAGATGAP